jgi:hypothetical protein
MPPHCDTKDGPVVTAARKALDSMNVNIILPWVHEDAENELKEAFDRVMAVRGTCQSFEQGVEVVNQWFFETAVRLHRAGEGEGFMGLKPAGLDEGPVVPKAEKALEDGSADGVIAFLNESVGAEVKKRFDLAYSLRKYDENNVPAARKYVSAMLDFMLYSHKLYKYITASGAHDKKEGAKGHSH